MHRHYSLLLAVAALLASTDSASAASIIFTIDPNLSTWDTSGSDNVYGAFQEQSPGSLMAPVSGHFLVDFDPATGTPSTLQFIGGHGYFTVASPHTLSPGIGGVGSPAPANGGGRTAGGEVVYAIRDLVWDFTSSPISRSGGVYPATQSSFIVLSGGVDSQFPGGSDPDAYGPFSDALTAGNWVLTESSPGSWTLSIDGYYDYTYNYGGVAVGTKRSHGVVQSTAQYGSANEDTVDPGDTQAEALGGSSTTGGVSATFSEPISGGGALSVQQVPDNTGLSQEAITAAEANPIFVLSTNTLATNPQIWNVNFTGVLAPGSVATLLFAYDESLLPLGLDELTLGIWHFNSNINDWEFGGTVDPFANTVTYVTDNFSPFQLGVVPEPSSLALAFLAGASLIAWGWRRRKRWK